jgi:hypothetical protein
MYTTIVLFYLLFSFLFLSLSFLVGSGKLCAWWMKWHNWSIRFVWEEKDDTSWTRPQVLEYSIRLMNNLGIIEASSTLITLDNGIEGYLHTICHERRFQSKSELKIWILSWCRKIWVWLLCAWTSDSHILFKFGFRNQWVGGWSEWQRMPRSSKIYWQ